MIHLVKERAGISFRRRLPMIYCEVYRPVSVIHATPSYCLFSLSSIHSISIYTPDFPFGFVNLSSLTLSHKMLRHLVLLALVLLSALLYPVQVLSLVPLIPSAFKEFIHPFSSISFRSNGRMTRAEV
jgi:hypothetical protein